MIADISHYQGEINWAAARKELKLCIFRASVGSNKDNKYLSYTKNCGIPFGVYHYVKAGTASEAEVEAKFFYETATQNNIQPLFFVADIEYETQTKSTTKPVTLAFCETLRRLGAKKVGLYIGQSRYPYIEDSLDKFDFIWIPRYGKNTGYADEAYKPKYPCDLWQYTSEGGIEGISGDVDLNKLNGTKTLEWFLQGYEELKKEETNMANKFTSQHFVEFCEKFVGRPYWYGTCVYTCTQDRYNSKSKQYPSHYTSSRAAKYKQHIAAKEVCADCVGMIKGYAWTNGGDTVFESIGTGSKITSKYKANNCPDKSANGMFSYAKSQGMEWGTIDTIPEIPGIAVRYDGHVGVYVGNGYVVEERGFNYGCVKTKLKDRNWLHWYKLPWIVYGEGTSVGRELGDRLLKKGMKGDDVMELQTLLTQLGYLESKIDGDFGSKTEAAVKEFQKTMQLEVDGEYGEKSHKAMMEAIGDDQPNFEEEVPEIVKPAPEVKPEEPAPAPTPVPEVKEIQLEVTGGSVRVRSGDSTSYSILTTVKKGNKLVPILGQDNKPLISKEGWYAIKRNDQIGWISGKYIKVL